MGPSAVSHPKLTGKPGGYKGVAYTELVDVELGGHGLCVAIKADGAGKVVRLDNDEGGLKAIWEFQDSVHQEFLGMTFSVLISNT